MSRSASVYFKALLCFAHLEQVTDTVTVELQQKKLTVNHSDKHEQVNSAAVRDAALNKRAIVKQREMGDPFL